MLNQKELSSLSKGDVVDHYLLIKKFEIRLTRQNKQYLNIELGDKSETLNANIFDGFDDIYNSFKNGEIVKAKGIIDEYQGAKQIRITYLDPVTPADDVSINDFLPKSSKDLSLMKEEFLKRMDSLSNDYLKVLMKAIFSGKKLENF